MSALEKVVTALESHGSRQTSRNSWCCPAHDDKHASLSVHQGREGVILKCHADCTAKEIADALDLNMADLFDEGRKEVARYPYADAMGEVVFAKIRFEPKGFGIVHPVDGGWEHGLNGSQRPLYRLPEVLAAIRDRETIYVVEGEKDADRLWSLGVPATCNFEGGGGSKWRPEYSDWLKGADVVVVADRDEPGQEHAMMIAKALTGKALSVRMAQSRTTGKGHDVSDHLDAGYGLADLVKFFPENEISRRYRRVDWTDVFRKHPDDVDWLLPPILEAGTINALFGKPGVGKSLLTLEFAVQLIRDGRRVMIMDDENRVADTVERLRSFGCTHDELDNLVMYNFAGLPPLDTPDGGEHLLALAKVNEPAMVVLDTTTRMVEGDENTANTWLQLYRCSLVPLKNRNIAVLRLDHPGKDDTKGQRGSSAKAGDVDCVWRLSDISNSDQLVLIREKSRSGHGEPVITFRREQKLDGTGKVIPGSLRHEIVALGDLDVLPQVRSVSRWFDRHDVPLDTGRPRLRDVLSSTQGAPEVSTTILALVARYRKSLLEENDVRKVH